MALQFDHAVILVNDLDAATADFQKVGFNPFFGGEHAGGKTHNALIVFEDGSYLELLAPTDPALLKTVDPQDRSSFLFMFQYGEGFGGYALLAADLESEAQAMRSRGLAIEMRTPGGRLRPDGQELRWRSAVAGGGSMTPFFIQDDTPRVLRVPNDPDRIHQPNGVTGVAGIGVTVGHLSTGVMRYQAIFDVQPHSKTDDSAEFQAGEFTISLTQSDSVHADRLTAIKLRAHETNVLDTALTHQARIELVPNKD